MPKRKTIHYEKLKKSWLKKQKDLQKDFLSKHKDSLEWLAQNGKNLTVGSLAGLILLLTPLSSKVANFTLASKSEIADQINQDSFVVYDLYSLLPREFGTLTKEQESSIAQILTRDYRINVVSEIGGKRLNTVYGKIGQEQHLARFPGDNMQIHLDGQEESNLYYDYGMAPGLGAWRYFADSQESMTEEDNLREKYYIAVQTFMAPNFYDNPKEYVDFFKYRKMLVVNPQNGKAIVVVIGDAGPAVWTGKHLGGSPEVMKYLERFDGKQVGAVLYYFIEDPENKIPLGPVKL